MNGGGFSSECLKLLLMLSGMLFVLAWMLPNHYLPWVMAYQEFISFFAGVLLLVVVFFTRPCSVPRECILFFFLPFIPLLQASFGLIYFSGDAWIAALYLGGFALMILVGYNLALDVAVCLGFVRLIAGVLVVGAVLSVWVALRQWLGLSGNIWVADMPPEGRPFANLAQPNNLATLLCMGLAGVLYFYEKYFFGRLASGILAFFLLFGVALTQSRSPWVGVLVATLFWMYKSWYYPSRLQFKGVLGWALVYVVCVFTLPLIAEWLSLPVAGPLERAQSLERWDMWVQFWHAIWLKPWGYGWNQVSTAQVAVSLAYPVPILTEHSHNIMLDLLLWNGPVIGVLIIFFIGVWMARLAWYARTSESLFALLAIGFVLVHAMLEYPLEYAFFLLPIGLLLGVVAAECRSRYEIIVPRWVLGWVLLAGVGLYGWIWHEYQIVEDDHRLMRFENSKIGDIKAEKAAPDIILLTQLREFIRFARTSATIGMTQAQLEWMRKVAHRYPFVTCLFRYSLALALNNQPTAAREQLLILRALHGDKHYAAGRQALQDMSANHPQLIAVLQVLPAIEP